MTLLGERRRVVGAPLGCDGEDAADEGDDEKQAGGNEGAAEASAVAHLTLQSGLDLALLAGGGQLAGGDELGDNRWKFGVRRDEFDGGGESGAAQDVVVGAAVGVPGSRRGAQLTIEHEVGAGVLEPTLELRPGAEHDFVDDVDAFAVTDDEALVNQRIEGRPQLGRQLVRARRAGEPTPRPR